MPSHHPKSTPTSPSSLLPMHKQNKLPRFSSTKTKTTDTSSTFPILTWLPQYSVKRQLGPDIVAGITTGTMAVPQSMSYALIAGLPPQYGLYSDIQFFYPILGTSKVLVVGPVAVMSLLIRATLESLEFTEMSPEWIKACCFACILVGIMQGLMSFLGLASKSVHLLSHDAISGFTSAAAVIIGSTQLTNFIGISKCQSDSSRSCSVLGNLNHVATHISHARALSLAVGAMSLVVLVMFRKQSHARHSTAIWTKCGPLAVVVLGILCAWFTSTWGVLDSSVSPVQTIGAIPSGLPFPSAPEIQIEPTKMLRLLLSCFPIAVVAYAEAYAIAKASTKTGDKTKLDADQEMLALAACNISTGFLGGYPVTGSFSRTAINAESGASSRMATAFAALFIILVLRFLTPILALLPRTSVAAIVMISVFRLFKFTDLLNLCKKWKNEKDWRISAWLVTFFGSLLVGVEMGLPLGIVTSIIVQRIALNKGENSNDIKDKSRNMLLEVDKEVRLLSSEGNVKGTTSRSADDNLPRWRSLATENSHSP